MNTKWVTGIVVVVVIILAIYVVQSARQPSNEGLIKMGISAPLTGEAASIGEAFVAGAELAVLEINESGGINGRNIELIIEDDKCTKDGVNSVSKLVNVDKVDVLIGPFCSAAAGPAVFVAQEEGTPTLVTGSSPDLTSAGNFIFRNYPSDALQGKYAAEFAHQELGKTKAAVIYVQNDWGVGNRNVFIERFRELGGEVVADEGVPQNTTDIRTQLTKVKSSNPDFLYFPVYPQAGAVGLRQKDAVGLTVGILGGEAFSTEEIYTLPEAEGVLFTQARVQNDETFNARVLERTGKTPHFVSAYGYDAVKVFATVIQKVGTDSEKVRQELASLNYTESVAVSHISFDEQGDLETADFEIKMVKDGGIVNYSPEN